VCPALPRRATNREGDAQTPREPMGMGILPRGACGWPRRLKEFVGAMSRTMFKERKSRGVDFKSTAAGRE